MAEGDRRPDGGGSFPRTSPDKFGSCCEEMREAIEGDGFFQVTLPNGTVRYTRDGAFQLNADSNIVTSSGYLLEPAITIPTGPPPRGRP